LSYGSSVKEDDGTQIPDLVDVYLKIKVLSAILLNGFPPQVAYGSRRNTKLQWQFLHFIYLFVEMSAFGATKNLSGLL